MHRRTLLAGGASLAAAAVAGCTDLLESDVPVDDEIAAEAPLTFSASEGETFRITADEVERDDDLSPLVRIWTPDDPAVFQEPIDGSLEDEFTLDHDADVTVAVSGGVANVRIERVE